MLHNKVKKTATKPTKSSTKTTITKAKPRRQPTRQIASKATNDSTLITNTHNNNLKRKPQPTTTSTTPITTSTTTRTISTQSNATQLPLSFPHHQQIANISILNSSSMHNTKMGMKKRSFTSTIQPFTNLHQPRSASFSTDTTADSSSSSSPNDTLSSTTTTKEKKPKENKKKKQTNDKPATDASAALGVQVKKDEDFSKWYQQLVVRSELIEYYDISGCYILRPWAYEIWEHITKFLDTEFKKLGVKNASFPLLVPRRNLEKEEDHIEGFAAEVAWVTHSGSTKLEEPVAIRPTSETIMYPAFKKWIQSHRDLPLRLNQWCNVLRWEFKDPTPFIRAREFLWQEGHTAYAKKEDADAEVYKILDLYERAYEEILACSVVKGHKTEHEKFAGGSFTTTIEGYIPGSGRGIQAATSHSLGQNFAKMFDVSFQDEDGQQKHVWQNSWGFTFRSMGVMIMTHSDDKGLVLPPKVAPIQAILIPIAKGENAEQVNAAVEMYNQQLLAKGIRSEVDARTNVSPGFKYNHWELRGVPVRIEIGQRDLDNGAGVLARRDLGTKSSIKFDNFADSVQEMLDTIQNDLRVKSKTAHKNAIHTATKWEDFMKIVNRDELGLVPWCEKTSCEQEIKTRSAEAAKDAGAERSGGAKSLCIPFEQPEGDVTKEKCLNCEDDAKKWVLFGRSY